MEIMTKLTNYERKTMLIFNWRDELPELNVNDPYQIQALNRLVKKGVLEIFIKPVVGGKVYRKVTK